MKYHWPLYSGMNYQAVEITCSLIIETTIPSPGTPYCFQAVPSLWNALPSPTLQYSNATVSSRLNPKDSTKFFWMLSI